jgi:CBS domain containing-hemolysin-like protein
LIAFLCVGVLFPFVLAALGIFSSIALVSLNAARMKGLEAQKNATSAMAEIQRQIDAENLDAMQSNQTGVPARY